VVYFADWEQSIVRARDKSRHFNAHLEDIMFILSITPGQVSTTVWTATSRTLSADPWTPTNVISTNTSLAGSTTADLRAPSGKIRSLSVASVDFPSGDFQAGLYDGTVFASQSVGVEPSIFQMGANGTGAAIKNLDTIAHHYSAYGFDR